MSKMYWNLGGAIFFIALGCLLLRLPSDNKDPARIIEKPSDLFKPQSWFMAYVRLDSTPKWLGVPALMLGLYLLFLTLKAL